MYFLICVKTLKKYIFVKWMEYIFKNENYDVQDRLTFYGDPVQKKTRPFIIIQNNLCFSHKILL